MDNNILPPYQFFGSQNSEDIDVVFFVNEISKSISDCGFLVKRLSNLLAEKNQYVANVNGNLAVLKDGLIIDVFKGTSDELNNALLHTYRLHKQDYTNQIYFSSKRDVNLKFLRCSRMILSYFTKSIYRSDIKNALRDNIEIKIEVLKKLEFVELIKNNDIELKKTIACQLGQTLALDEGKELYTKDDIGEYMPVLMPHLSRVMSAEVSVLQKILTIFLKKLEDRLVYMEQKIEYKPIVTRM